MEHEKPPFFDQLIAMPTWTLNNLIFPFLPEDHTWKKAGRTPPLDMWTLWRTPLATLFDTAIWLCTTIGLVTLLSIYFKRIAS